MLSDLLDVERCSVFLYDGLKDNLFCKVITGRLREPITMNRESENILCQVFNTGLARYFKRAQADEVRDELGEYITIN